MKRLQNRLIALLALAAAAAATPPALAGPVDELLRIVPNDAGACLIVEDFAARYREAADSELWRRVQQSPLYAKWNESPGRRRLQQLWAIAPFYLGVSGPQLRDDIFGQAVVLALLPAGRGEGRDVGVLLCNAHSETAMSSLTGALTTAQGNRAVEQRRHRDVPYFWRREGNKRPDQLLRLGSIGVITDSEEALRLVIDAHLDGGGLGDREEVQAARQALPAKSLAQLIVRPRAFDHALLDKLKSAKDSDAAIVEGVTRFWTSLRWTAFTIRLEDALQVSIDWQLQAQDQTEAEPSAARASFWERLPENAFAAAAVDIDLPATVRLFTRLMGRKERHEAGLMARILQQLVVGFDLQEDVLPRLGPMIGLVVRPGSDSIPQVLGALQVRSDSTPPRYGVNLETALEFALRPILVFAGMEHNREKEDQLQAGMSFERDARIHYLHGSQLSPWLQPAFAVHAGYLLVASHPQAISDWCAQTAGEKSQSDGHTSQQLAFVNLRAIVEHVQAHPGKVVSLLAGSPDREPKVREDLERILAAAGLFDRITLSSDSTGSTKRLSLELSRETPETPTDVR